MNMFYHIIQSTKLVISINVSQVTDYKIFAFHDEGEQTSSIQLRTQRHQVTSQGSHLQAEIEFPRRLRQGLVHKYVPTVHP